QAVGLHYKMTTIYAFANQKGGVGKTTSAVNVAAFLADAGQRVLLVDLDAQGNATACLGVERFALPSSIYNCLTEEMPLADVTLPTAVSRLSLAPSTNALAGAELELAS